MASLTNAVQVPEHCGQSGADWSLGGDGALELLLVDDLLALLVLELGVLVLRPSLGNVLEVAQRLLELAEAHVGGRPPVVALQVAGICLDGRDCVLQRVPVALHAQVGEGTVRVVDRVLVVQLDCFRVELYALLVVFLCGRGKVRLVSGQGLDG